MKIIQKYALVKLCGCHADKSDIKNEHSKYIVVAMTSTDGKWIDPNSQGTSH